MTRRTQTRVVYAGGVPIGGGNPILLQSMTNTDTRDTDATISQIRRMTEAGCELARVAIPDMAAAEALSVIKKAVSIPISADIHFDYRLALAAIQNGADKLRINPGNIGDPKKVRQIATAAKASGLPIRVGVNAGSLEKDILQKNNGVTPDGIAESALRHIQLLEDCGFQDIVVSVKASDIPTAIEAYRLTAKAVDYPLHIGITESGTPYRGSIRSAVGLGTILSMGLGDTLRVSLTGDPVDELRCAKEILQALNLRRFGVTFVSCPTCGRTEIDLISLAQTVEAYCETLTTPIKVAVMGCVVNGPGEARDADIGLAGGRGQGVLFRKGQVVRKVPEDQMADALIEEIKALVTAKQTV